MFDGGRYTAIYGVREPISFSPTYIALSGRWWGMGDEHGMRNHNYGPPSQMKPSKVTKNHQYSVEPEGFAWKSVQVLRRLVYSYSHKNNRNQRKSTKSANQNPGEEAPN